MKATILITAMLLFGAVVANAQSNPPEPDTLSSPVKQTDPEPDAMPREINYTSGMTKITSAELPKAIVQTLDASNEYAGWRKAAVYKDKAGKKFVIEMKEADATRVYRFDRNGRLQLD